MNDLYISEIVMNRDKITGNSNDPDTLKYPFSIPVIKNLDRIKLGSKVTFLAGENGTGKSTLLEAVAVNFGFNAEGGSRNFSFSTMSSHSELYDHITLYKGVKRPKDGYFLRAESFYNVVSEIEYMDSQPAAAPLIKDSYGGKSLHEQSHGESFLSLILNRFSGNGLYILDEPEAALSPSRQMTVLSRISELVKLNSQFIIATHSPILLAYPGAEIFILSENSIKLTPYMETEHYTITKQFLNNPERMLEILINQR